MVRQSACSSHSVIKRRGVGFASMLVSKAMLSSIALSQWAPPSVSPLGQASRVRPAERG